MKKQLLWLLCIFPFCLQGQQVSFGGGIDLFYFPEFKPEFSNYSESYFVDMKFPIDLQNSSIGIMYRNSSYKGYTPYGYGKGKYLHHYLDSSNNAFDFSKYESGIYNFNNRGIYWGTINRIIGLFYHYEHPFSNKWYASTKLGAGIELTKTNFYNTVSTNGFLKIVDPAGEETEIVGPVFYSEISEAYFIMDFGVSLSYLLTKHLSVGLCVDFYISPFSNAYLPTNLFTTYNF